MFLIIADSSIVHDSLVHIILKKKKMFFFYLNVITFCASEIMFSFVLM